MLLFSQDEPFIAMLAAAFPQLQVAEELDIFDRRVDSTRVDILIIDCDDHPEGIRALKLVRSSKANIASPLIAVLNGNTLASDAQDLGAWLTIEKTAAWKSLRSMKDWLRGVIRREHYRFPFSDFALIDSGGLIGRQVMMVNISLGGASFTVEGVAELENHLTLRLSCGRFPCEIVWREASGRVGVRFMPGRFGKEDLRRLLGTDHVAGIT